MDKINMLMLSFNANEKFIFEYSNYFQYFFKMITKFQVLSLKISII